MQTSIVIPNYNGLSWLSSCLSSIFSQNSTAYEVIMVDNGSTDDSILFVRNNYPEIILIEFSKNFGFAKAVNEGIDRSTGEFILLLNNDTILQPGFLENITKCLREAPAKIGAVNPKMLQLDQPHLLDDMGDSLSWYGEARKIGHNSPAQEFNEKKEIFSPSGGASLFRKSFLKHCGVFDERFFAYLEDVDLGLRGRLLGYSYLFCPSATVMHKGHGTSMPYSKYIRLTTCNRLLIWTKNIPFDLWRKHFLKFIYGQLYFFLAHGKPMSTIKGYLRFCQKFPHALKMRSEIKKTIHITKEEIEHSLNFDKPCPSLKILFVQYFKAIRKKFFS